MPNFYHLLGKKKVKIERIKVSIRPIYIFDSIISV